MVSNSQLSFDPWQENTINRCPATACRVRRKVEESRDGSETDRLATLNAGFGSVDAPVQPIRCYALACRVPRPKGKGRGRSGTDRPTTTEAGSGGDGKATKEDEKRMPSALKGTRQQKLQQSLTFATAAVAYYDADASVKEEPTLPECPPRARLIPGTASLPDVETTEKDACLASYTALKLSLDLGSQPTQRWPVWWDHDLSIAAVFDAPMPTVYPRAEAEFKLAGTWTSFCHMGSVPASPDATKMVGKVKTALAVAPTRTSNDTTPVPCIPSAPATSAGPRPGDKPDEKETRNVPPPPDPLWYLRHLGNLGADTVSITPGSVDGPLPAARATGCPAKRMPVVPGADAWIVDTGCGHDLLDRSRLIGNLVNHVRKARHDVVFETAGGDAPANEEIDVHLPGLPGGAKALIMDSSPEVISVGRRCEAEGWSFHWHAYSKYPCLITPAGRVIRLISEGFIPYYKPSLAPSFVPCVPAVATEGEPEPAMEVEEFDDRGMCEKDLREEAVSIAHLMTHYPKNRHCIACQRSRLRRRANRRSTVDKEASPEFGALVTMDHVYAHTTAMEGIDGSLDMLVVYDVGTEKVDAYPAKSKSSDCSYAAIQDFRGRTYLDMIYSDNSKEIKSAVRELGFPHRTSVPGIPQTNTLAEGRVNIVCNGTKTALENAGLPCAFWPYAARHFCFGLATRDVGGATSYFRQQGAHFGGPQIPFGCRVFFKPSPISKHQAGKFETNATAGIMMGYVLDPGGKWSGELLVVELEAMAGRPLHRNTAAAQLRVHVQRVREV